MAEGTAPMVRAQILLTPVQRERLERLARRQGRKLSDVTRRALDIGLDALEGHSDEELRRRQQALSELDGIRSRVCERHSIYAGDLVAQAREERERQQDQLWRDG
jgi:hypothetical protein